MSEQQSVRRRTIAAAIADATAMAAAASLVCCFCRKEPRFTPAAAVD